MVAISISIIRLCAATSARGVVVGADTVIRGLVIRNGPIGLVKDIDLYRGEGGAFRRIGVAVERKAPATGRAIAAMVQAIMAAGNATGKQPTLAALRDRALLLIGFAAALRRSELVALDIGDVTFVDDGLIVLVRRSKTDQEGAGADIAVPKGSRLKRRSCRGSMALKSARTRRRHARCMPT